MNDALKAAEDLLEELEAEGTVRHQRCAEALRNLIEFVHRERSSRADMGEE